MDSLYIGESMKRPGEELGVGWDCLFLKEKILVAAMSVIQPFRNGIGLGTSKLFGYFVWFASSTTVCVPSQTYTWVRLLRYGEEQYTYTKK